jgi:hypothetical protein
MGSGGSTGNGGSSGGAGASGKGGSSGMAGASGNGGATGKGGSSGMAGASGSGGAAGATGKGGSTGSGGAAGATGAGGATGVDQGGVALAKPGDMVTASKQYLNLGDMRLINNRWGSDATNCTSSMYSVFVNTDKTIGYNFTRGTCGGSRGDPDFPEVEFGVAPFGMTSTLLTSPPYSSTTLLPIQLGSLKSASVTLSQFASTVAASTQYPGYWDSNIEFWISRNDPTTNASGGVYAEIILFTSYEAGRTNSNQGGWTCDKSGNVTAGAFSFTLCHQNDNWPTSMPMWRFFNYNVNNAPITDMDGKIDIKAMLDGVRAAYSGFTDQMYLTRIEVGTEVDDKTMGSVKINNLTFEINGTQKSVQTAN